MIVYENNTNFRRVAKANPRFNMDDFCLDLKITTQTQVKDDLGNWLDLPETKNSFEMSLGNNRFIDPATLLFCEADSPNAVPAFDFILSITPSMLGMTSLDQPISEPMAVYVENFLRINNVF